MHEYHLCPDDVWDKFDLPSATKMYIQTYFEDFDLDEIPENFCFMSSHDCMWGGMCCHEIHSPKKPRLETESPVVAVTVAVQPVKSSRSVLRANRVRTRSLSPRPETPSESEEDDCFSVCENDYLHMLPVSVSEVTGQIRRTSSDFSRISSPPSPSAFHTDHSYHQSKTTVTLDNLGVQTPSDSEEEIDVVSVSDREKITTLPTNPSAKDKQHIQQTVASAIQHRRSRGRRAGPSTEEDAPPVVTGIKRKRHHKSLDDSCDKRNQHNNMERLRRIDLKDSISRLRKLVPNVSKNERAPKVLVLKEATRYVCQLRQSEKKLLRRKTSLEEEQVELAARLRELRRQQAIERGCFSIDQPSCSKKKQYRCESLEPQRRKTDAEKESYRRKRK